jgi:hypothetical protein
MINFSSREKPLKVVGEFGRSKQRTIAHAEQNAPTIRNSYRQEAKGPSMLPMPYLMNY